MSVRGATCCLLTTMGLVLVLSSCAVAADRVIPWLDEHQPLGA